MSDLWQKVVVATVAAIIGAAAGVGASLVPRFLPDNYEPIPIGDCGPRTLYVGDELRCEEKSQYVDEVTWNFGSKAVVRRKSSDENRIATYRVLEAGKYDVVLTALRRGRENKTQAGIQVVVLRKQDLPTPIVVNITAKTRSSSTTEERVFQVSRTKDDHPVVFGPHSRSYSDVFEAEGGTRFIDTAFVIQSASRASDIVTRLLEEGRRVQVSYRLTSGPQTDRYRGWLAGKIRARQQRDTPSREFVIARDLTLDRIGRYALPRSLGGEIDEVIFVGSEEGGKRVARLGERVIWTDRRTTFGVERDGDGLVVEVGRL